MSALYAYSFLEKGFTRDEVTEYLDTVEEITNWFYSLPNMVFVETEISAKELSKLVEAKFGAHRHFITKVSATRWGRLPKEQWKFFP
jgi:hypothetical protein